ncbi:hypothetical protein Cni_G15966 [Canna indica]|uniref:Uncharacterized protein n=1 Tax=Canna indica TaxID=4628 RepID=A0AAQ3QFH6_9LILI|nr:hypothetical protein Cni_G15966 [Canna indica]
MEDILMQSEVTSVDKPGHVVLDIESLTLSSDKCTGSPKMTQKILSRKGSNRMERRNCEEQVADEATKKVVVKAVACSQMEQVKQPLAANKTLLTVPNSANAINSDAADGKCRKLNRLTTFNPRRILLLFASLSSMGTIILIYFTLVIYRQQSIS